MLCEWGQSSRLETYDFIFMTFPKRQNYSDGITNQPLSWVEMGAVWLSRQSMRESFWGVGGTVLSVVCSDGNKSVHVLEFIELYTERKSLSYFKNKKYKSKIQQNCV